MKYMTHDDIRKTWLKFFESKGHKIYESAPLVPINDDSLLWINAGVTPLKKYFDGTEIPDSRRIVNIQYLLVLIKKADWLSELLMILLLFLEL